MYLKIKYTFLLCCCTAFAFAQKNIVAADKVIAVVGSHAILQSDVNAYFYQLKIEHPELPDSTKCNILYDMVAEKLMVDQALRDSIIVSPGQVDEELDNRVRNYMARYGGKEAMEQKLGKSVYQIKEEYRDIISNQLTAQQLQAQVVQDLRVTPEEVNAFYQREAKKELPYVNASVEVGQIIYNPEVSKEIEEYTKNELQGIRDQIVNENRDFGNMAGIYSQDEGSRDLGGEITSRKSDLDPAFASAAFRLQNGEVSPVIRSSFGYHIIQMIKRTGDEAKFRHILLIPNITSGDLALATAKLDSAKVLLDSNKISYGEALNKYGNDLASKSRGGMMFSPITGETTMEIKDLDIEASAAISDMKVGDYSAPQIFRNPNKRGAQSVRILYLKNRIDPHTANLTDDYSLFQTLAKTEKTQEFLRKYVAGLAKSFYIKMDNEYSGCTELKPFYDRATSFSK